MARTPNPVQLVENQEGSSLAKKRLVLFLRTVGGDVSVPQACAELGVNEAAFHRMRSRWLAESVKSLEPRKTGPRPKDDGPLAEDVITLQEKVVDLERRLKCSQAREELRVILPGVQKKRHADRRGGHGARGTYGGVRDRCSGRSHGADRG